MANLLKYNIVEREFKLLSFYYIPFWVILFGKAYLVFWLGCLAFVLDGLSINGRFEAERPPGSAGPPSGEWAAFITTMQPLYSTEPHGLVQAIFCHTCPDLDFDPWYCLTHLIHIALSGSMTSRVRVSARFQPSPPLYPHSNQPSGFWPCIKSCLVGGSDKYHILRKGMNPLILPVMG